MWPRRGGRGLAFRKTHDSWEVRMRNTPRWSVLVAALAMATCTDKTNNTERDVDQDEVVREGSQLAGGQHLEAGDESAKVYKAALARFEARAAPATTVSAAAWPAAVAYTRGVRSS